MEKCWFCKKRPAEKKANITFELGKKVGEDSTMLRPGLGTRTEYYKTHEITIPRCMECKSIDKWERLNMVFGVLTLLSIFAAVAFYFGLPKLLSLIFIPPAIIFGFFWIRNLRKLAKKAREYGLVETSWVSHPEIARRRKNGWNVSKKRR